MLVLAAMAIAAAGCGGCGDEDSANETAASDAAAVPPATAPESKDPEQAAADRAERAKVFAAVLEDVEADREEMKKTLIRPERSKFIPEPEEFDEQRIDPAPSSGEKVSTGFATFDVPKGWVERSAQKGSGTTGNDRLTQLVPAAEAKDDDSEATYSAAITVQERPKSPVWANATEKDVVQFAMLYDSADPTAAVSMTVDGSSAVGFGFDAGPSRMTSVYTVNGGNLFQINGTKTNPADDSTFVQSAVLTIVNSWSWN